MEKRFFIFFDLDGTLYPFNIGATPEELRSREYFEGLSPSEGILDTVHELNASKRVEIFALGTALSADAVRGKMNALRRDFKSSIRPANRLFTLTGDKAALALKTLRGRGLAGALSRRTILIDDYTPNLIKWQEAGGRAVKFLNGLNDTTGAWTGEKMTADGSITGPRMKIFPGSIPVIAEAVAMQAVTDWKRCGPSERDEIESFLDSAMCAFDGKELVTALHAQSAR